MRFAVFALALLGCVMGCMPTFETVECFDDDECAAQARCRAQRCVADLQLDMASTDAARVDGSDGATVDSGQTDAAAMIDAATGIDAAAMIDAATGIDAAAMIDAATGIDAAIEPPMAELIGRWSFTPGSERIDATGHWAPLELFGTARIEDGALWVDGYRNRTRGFARATSWGAGDITEKTYVAWVSMRGLDVVDGAIMSLSDRQGTFEALAWGRGARHAWSLLDAGFRDTILAPSAPVDQLHQVAMSWRRVDLGAEVVICVDGIEVDRQDLGALSIWRNAATDLLFGTSRLLPDQRGRWIVEGQNSADHGGIDARIDEVQLFRGALTCAQAGQLTQVGDPPPQPAPPEPGLIGQWSFTEGAEAVDSTGNWDDLEFHGQAMALGGRLIGGFGVETGFARAVGWQGGLIREKTFVAWARLTDPPIHGGALIALDSRIAPDPKADALTWFVYGHGQAWTPDDDGRMGVRLTLVGQDDEPTLMRQVALSYAALPRSRVRITLCVDGERVGAIEAGPMADWRSDAEVLMGVRMLVSHPLGRWDVDDEPQRPEGDLVGEIDEVRLYRGALSCDQVRVLAPAP